MSDSTQTTGGAAPNRTMIILLGVIALLLVAIIAIIFLGKGGQAPSTGTAATGTTAGTGTTGMPATPAGAPFDPATATKVAAGVKPEDHVKAYFDAVVSGDYATAYALLPADKRAAQDEASFGEQLKGYGVSAYTIDNAVEQGDEAQITATASMAGGEFQYLWTFVKDGDGWLVKSRTLPGMGQ